MPKTKFKKDFINSLDIPNDLKLELPKDIKGFIRFNNDKLDSVYIKNIRPNWKDNEHTWVILKFKYRNFHYSKPDFIFDRMYVCGDKSNEFGYDKDLNMTTKYLKGDVILSNLNKEDKDHVESVLKEWKSTNKFLKSKGKEFISAYQIEKNNKKVKIPYLICENKLDCSDKYKYLDIILNNIVKEYNWGCKCDIKENKIIKSNNIYIIID